MLSFIIAKSATNIKYTYILISIWMWNSPHFAFIKKYGDLFLLFLSFCCFVFLTNPVHCCRV